MAKTSAASQTGTAAAAKGPRRLHLPVYRPFRRPHVTHPESLPGAWQLMRRSWRVIWHRRGQFLALLLIYAILSLVFVHGFGGQDVQSLKDQAGSGLGGVSGAIVTGVTVFTGLLTSAPANAPASAGAYQLFIGLIISLAAIWLLRYNANGQMTTVREAFYKGMYPLVPFVLVLVVILVEMLPFVVGGFLYSVVLSTGIASTLFEQILFGAIFAALALVTVYFLCSSVLALYIVTLPDMGPVKALKSARQLVMYRRAGVLRRLLFLPLMLLVAGMIILLPAILWLPVVAAWILFVLSLAALLATHSYIYSLYKALLA